MPRGAADSVGRFGRGFGSPQLATPRGRRIGPGSGLGGLPGRLLPEHSPDAGGRLWAAQVIPLCVSATEPAQAGQLLRRLDAFGDGADVQMPAKGQDGIDDRGVVAVLPQSADEGVVDLEGATGKFLIRLREE